MTITYYFFDYELQYIISTILLIIQSCSLFIGSRVLKKEVNELRYIRALTLTGYILTIWYIGTFFLPTNISLLSPITESEEFISFTIVLLIYIILPNSFNIILGVAFFFFFYRNDHLYQKPLVYTAILFTGGYVLILVNGVLARYLVEFDVYAYIDLVDLFLALNIVSLCVLISSILVLILFSIYLNSRFFMIFSSLYLFQLFYILIPLLPFI